MATCSEYMVRALCAVVRRNDQLIGDVPRLVVDNTYCYRTRNPYLEVSGVVAERTVSAEKVKLSKVLAGLRYN